MHAPLGAPFLSLDLDCLNLNTCSWQGLPKAEDSLAGWVFVAGLRCLLYRVHGRVSPSCPLTIVRASPVWLGCSLILHCAWLCLLGVARLMGDFRKALGSRTGESAVSFISSGEAEGDIVPQTVQVTLQRAHYTLPHRQGVQWATEDS